MVLPSQGEFYHLDGKPTVPDGKIQVRRMGYAEEEKLSAPGMDYIDRLAVVTRNCVKLPDPKALTVDDLLTTDRMALLLWIRALTYGPTFSFQWRCRECGATSRMQVNIAEEFDVRTPEKVRVTLAEKEPDAVLEEPWAVALPDCGKSVQLRFLRGKDESQVFSRAKRNRMSTTDAGDSSTAFRIAKQIVTIDSVPPVSIVSAEQFVKEVMSARDRAKVRISTERRETAIDTTVYPNCKACGAANETPVRFDADFFFPSDVVG